MKATLETLQGIESITIKTEQGQTVVLKKGEPAIIKDADRHLVAAVQRLPVKVEDKDAE
jgi:hypothetical protein